jgi:VanZ family protein
MLPLRYERQWRIAGGILLLGVLAATLMPAVWMWPNKVQMLKLFVEIDKWFHILSFVFLAVWFAGQYRRSDYWRIAAGLLAFGVLIEGCQRLVTYRSAEWYDIVADAAGILVGLGIALAGMGGWSQRFETWLLRRRAAAGNE